MECAKKIADELEELLPEIKSIQDANPATGHLAIEDGYIGVTKRFIAGCREAHSKKEKLKFQ